MLAMAGPPPMPRRLYVTFQRSLPVSGSMLRMLKSCRPTVNALPTNTSSSSSPAGTRPTVDWGSQVPQQARAHPSASGVRAGTRVEGTLCL